MGVPSDLRALALELSEPDRAELASDLLLSLEPGGMERDADYKESWRVEIQARSRALAEGRAALHSREEVESRMRLAIARVGSGRL